MQAHYRLTYKLTYRISNKQGFYGGVMDNYETMTWLYENIYPRFFYIWLLILAFIIQFTFSGHIEKTGDKNTFHLVMITLKKKLLVAYILSTAFFFLCVYGFAWKALDEDFDKASKYTSLLLSEIIEGFISVTGLLNLILLMIVPFMITLIHRRYVKPKISSIVRKYRVSQTSDTMSDIRIENEKYNAKEFDPNNFYKDDYFFLGKDEKDQPIYKPDSYIAKNNIKILGATQTGKGVLQGVIIDQAIRKDWGVWFFDQKPDDFIYSIMIQACKDSNIEAPIIFDINNYRGVSYEPFKHGSERERLSRLYKAFDIEAGGTDADFYKRKARTVIRTILPKWNGELKNLNELVSGTHPDFSDIDNETILKFGDSIREAVSEWLSLNSIGSHGETVLNINELIKEGKVVYILGNTKDKLVKAINKSLLTEWTQSVINIKPEKHIYAAIDEVRFIISPELADSLATILSKNANISIAYQERDDLLNVDNEISTISLSIKKASETNTNLTFIYKCGNETAEWIAKESGTIAKSLTKLEEVDTDGFGAESWKGKRMIGQQEEHYIPMNTILSLPPRVGVMQANDDLSKVIFSCWVKIKNGIKPLPPILNTHENKIQVATEKEASNDTTLSDDKKSLMTQQLNEKFKKSATQNEPKEKKSLAGLNFKRKEE